jgi:hypothetical protein
MRTNGHERNLGRAAWRDKLALTESRLEITNPYFPALRCGQWLLQGSLAKSKLLTAMIDKLLLKNPHLFWKCLIVILKIFALSNSTNAEDILCDVHESDSKKTILPIDLFSCGKYDLIKFNHSDPFLIAVSKNAINDANETFATTKNSENKECNQKLSHADLRYSSSLFFEDVSLIKWESAAVLGSTLMLGFMDWDWGSSSFYLDSEGFFGKDTISGGMDKLGHIYGSYALADFFTYSINRKSGNLEQAASTGSIMSWGVMLVVETMDGFSGDHGFSPEDLLMNTIGVTLSYFRNTNPELEKKIDFRLEYVPSGYDREFSPHTDYAGQKYLLALKLGGFEKLEETPLRYFEIQAGYFTEGFNGKEATARDRHLFVGIGLNLEELLFGRKNEKESTCKFAGRQFLQRVQIPYTYFTNDNDAYHY